MDKMAALYVAIACDSNTRHRQLQTRWISRTKLQLLPQARMQASEEVILPTHLPPRSRISLLYTMPTRTTLSNTTASEPSENCPLPGLCNANIYIRHVACREAFQSMFSLALKVLYMRLHTKQLERLAAEHADDRQARLQQLRTCVRSLTRMALPQARPTILCIY